MRFLFLIAIFISPLATATTTICNITGDDFSPMQALSWNTETGEAKIRSSSRKVHEGKVSLVRKHSNGLKVNLVFNGFADQDEMEYIVFPALVNGHRIIGVGYKIIDGQKYLDISDGNYPANCSSL